MEVDDFYDGHISDCFYAEGNYEKCINKLFEWFRENNSNLTSKEIEKNISDFLDVVVTNNKKMIKNIGKKYNFNMRKDDDFNEYSINIDPKTYIQTNIVSRCYIKTDNMNIIPPNHTLRSNLDQVIAANPNNIISAKHIFQSRLYQAIMSNSNILKYQEYEIALFFWKKKNPGTSPSHDDILSMKYYSFMHSLYFYLSNCYHDDFIGLCEKTGLSWSKNKMNNNTEYYSITIDHFIFHFINQTRLTYYELK